MDALFQATSNGTGDDDNYGDDQENDDDDNDGLLARTRRRQQRPDSDPDAMDWEPISPLKRTQARPQSLVAGAPGAAQRPRKSKDDGTWLRAQKFFPPEEPTGLEGLFMRTRLVDEDEQRVRSMNSVGGRRWKWGWVYSVSVVPVVGILVGLWMRS